MESKKFMRIATYNIWDSDSGMPMRFQHLIDEIKNVDADIMCLQRWIFKEGKWIFGKNYMRKHVECRTIE